jgi:hypothetical protein
MELEKNKKLLEKNDLARQRKQYTRFGQVVRTGLKLHHNRKE